MSSYRVFQIDPTKIMVTEILLDRIKILLDRIKILLDRIKIPLDRIISDTWLTPQSFILIHRRWMPIILKKQFCDEKTTHYFYFYSLMILFNSILCEKRKQQQWFKIHCLTSPSVCYTYEWLSWQESEINIFDDHSCYLSDLKEFSPRKVCLFLTDFDSREIVEVEQKFWSRKLPWFLHSHDLQD